MGLVGRVAWFSRKGCAGVSALVGPVCGGWLAMGVAGRQPLCLWFDECRPS